MAKVYLSPAYHRFNTCAVAGCDETTHNNLYLDALTPYLDACGIQWKRGPRRIPNSAENGDTLMRKAVAESDAWGADVHYVSHTNASNGAARGYRPIIYTGSVGGTKLAEKMIARRREIYDQPIRLNQRTDLYELRVPRAVSYYEEHVFHDNPEDAAWFHGHLRQIAAATARGLCDYFGLPFRDPYVSAGQPEDNGDMTAVLLPVLRRGKESASVKAVQVLLNAGGYESGQADGIFGANTYAAVRRFQTANALEADGIVGVQTWGRLLQ